MTDNLKTVQLPFWVRHCNRNYEIEEDFIGIYPCDNGLHSDALLRYIKDIKSRISFKNDKLIRTTFDGATICAGRRFNKTRTTLCKHSKREKRKP